MLILPTVAALILAQPLAQPLTQPDDRALAARAAAVVPAQRQIAWQRLEFEVFIHFGMNTFTDREWGEGNEDPILFNPTDLDAEQWAQSARDAGARALVLVAKHHDGFCLWPTKFSEHCVRNSPWRGGKGDVVRECAEACRKHNLKFGVYLSPADLHEPTYGKSGEYNRFFLNQLRELLTGYGPIHEVWFDGATPRDKGQVYDYQAWYALIRELQPDAVIFGRGPDVRWVGNESGHARASEWSVIPLASTLEECRWPDLTGADLGSLDMLRGATTLHWYPAETDTSIRPGWFWHEKENGRVRSLDDLLNVYYGAVGGNSVLLLNVPPDRRGRFHENDVSRLRELGSVLKATFAANLAAGARGEAGASVPGHDITAALDGNPDTFWTSPDWPGETSITFTLPSPRKFNVVMLQEHIASGQRIEKFAVDVWDWNMWSTAGSGWKEAATGTTVGYKKLMRIPAIESDRVRIRILDARVRPTIAEFGLFVEPVRLAAPTIARSRDGTVTIASKQAEASGFEYGVGDGAWAKYEKPFALPRGGMVRARALGDSAAPAQVAEAEFDVCKAKWKIVSVSSDQANAGEGAENAIDDNPDSIWHSRYAPDTARHPHEIVIDLGETLPVRGATYLPRRSGPNGRVVKYQFFTSGDGKEWGAPAAEGEFANMRNNPAEQRIVFAAARECRYLKFVALSEVNGKEWASAAEIGVVTRP